MSASKCYKCTERYLGCHSDCEWYKTFRAQRDAALIQKNKDSNMNNFESDVKKLTIKKYGGIW